MPLLLPAIVGVLFAAGVYLVLQRNLLRVVFGLVLLSNSVNLLLLAAGRIGPTNAPLIAEGADIPVAPFANPLPQALVLTAIVIGFGLVAFTLVLVMRAYRTFGTVDADRLEEGTEAVPAGAPEVVHAEQKGRAA